MYDTVIWQYFSYQKYIEFKLVLGKSHIYHKIFYCNSSKICFVVRESTQQQLLKPFGVGTVFRRQNQTSTDTSNVDARAEK